MENVYRNDIHQFFKDMPPVAQKQAIGYLQKIIKKPPETKEAEKKEVID